MVGMIRVGQVVQVPRQQAEVRREAVLGQEVLPAVEETDGELVEHFGIHDLLEPEADLVAVDVGVVVQIPREEDVVGIQHVAVVPLHLRTQVEREHRPALDGFDFALGDASLLDGIGRATRGDHPLVPVLGDGAEEDVAVVVTAATLQDDRVLDLPGLGHDRLELPGLPVLLDERRVHLVVDPARDGAVLDGVAEVRRLPGHVRDDAPPQGRLGLSVGVELVGLDGMWALEVFGIHAGLLQALGGVVVGSGDGPRLGRRLELAAAGQQGSRRRAADDQGQQCPQQVCSQAHGLPFTSRSPGPKRRDPDAVAPVGGSISPCVSLATSPDSRLPPVKAAS